MICAVTADQRHRQVFRQMAAWVFPPASVQTDALRCQGIGANLLRHLLDVAHHVVMLLGA